MLLGVSSCEVWWDFQGLGVPDNSRGAEESLELILRVCLKIGSPKAGYVPQVDVMGQTLKTQ